MTMALSLWGNAEIQRVFSIFDAGVSKDRLESRDHPLSNVKKKKVMGSFEENGTNFRGQKFFSIEKLISSMWHLGSNDQRVQNG